MKQLIIISLVLLGFSCKAQEPDVHSYSQEYIDSVINVYLIQLNELSANYQLQIDSCSSLIELLQSTINSNEMLIRNADTFKLDLTDDRIKVEVNKIGHDVWVLIEDGAKRLNADYVNHERNVVMMDSLYSIGFLFINNNSTKGFSTVDFNH